ncbi:ribosomal protein L28 [Bradyrhizobium sp. LM3.2]
MPPSGKMPVSTAALRTISQTAPMSRRLSRLAEYSIVKCGIAVSLPVFLFA